MNNKPTATTPPPDEQKLRGQDLSAFEVGEIIDGLSHLISSGDPAPTSWRRKALSGLRDKLEGASRIRVLTKS